MDYGKHVSKQETPQTQPLWGETQVRNRAGGFVYRVGKQEQLLRFLILGTEGGTYYVKEQELTRKNATNVEACLKEDPEGTIKTIVEVSKAGRAVKNDAAIFALVLASIGEPKVRALAWRALPEVCRIPTHLFTFLKWRKGLIKGFSRQARTAVSQWYARWDAKKLEYEIAKYQQRGGWSHRDVARLLHLKPTAEGKAIYTYMAKGVPIPGGGMLAAMFEALHITDEKELASHILQHGLTHEMIPSEMKKSAVVWEALLDGMPITAMVRGLGQMTSVGLIKPLSQASGQVVERLGNRETLKRGRVHPFSLLVALKIYQQGHGEKGKLTWTPDNNVVDALNEAFYTAFEFVEPMGLRTIIALDVSGSMGAGQAGGLPLTPAEAGAAMAMLLMRTEPLTYTLGYATAIKQLPLTKGMGLPDVLNVTRRETYGSTDCSQPFIWAQANGVDADIIVSITDNETWDGRQHTSVAANNYRQKVGHKVKVVSMAMTATESSVVDPKDPHGLNVVGMDAGTPGAIAEFGRL